MNDQSNEKYFGDQYRIDDLQCGGFELCQDRSGFCFGTDAVLLADFAAKQVRKGSKLIDLCTGNGVIPILMHARRNDLFIDAVEIDEPTSLLAQHNLTRNRLESKSRILCADMKHLPKSMYGTYDAVTVNPPYIPLGKGLIAEESNLTGARHEVFATLNDVAEISYALLKEKGMLYMIHRTHRAAEIIQTLRERGLEPKSLRFVHKDIRTKSNLILIAASKHSGSWLDVLPPLILHHPNGSETEELQEIYSRKTT